MAFEKYDAAHGDIKTYLTNMARASKDTPRIRYLFKHWVQYKIIYNNQVNTIMNGPYEGDNAHEQVERALRTILMHPRCISACRVSELIVTAPEYRQLMHVDK